VKSNFIFMDDLRTPPDALSLASLPVGGRGLIADVRAGDAVGERLLDLGLLPGTPILVLRRAPLGDPSVYELRGYQLCLRRSEAERVRVRPIF
jgi:ferrous iron transport protein A